jgi:DNA-binding MarR family transcriptional regulator
MAATVKKTSRRRGLDQADYERLAEFRYLLRRFLMFSEDAAIATGLTAQQHQALLAIRGWGGVEPMTARTLAEALGIRHHSAVGLIDRLAAKALVRRRANPPDRREMLLDLSAKSQKLLEKLSAAHRDELNRLAPLLRTLLDHFERL